jgi:hypothetical protein
MATTANTAFSPRPSAAPARVAADAALPKWPPYLAAVLVYFILLPYHTDLRFESSVIPLARIVLIPMAILVANQFVRRRIVFGAADWLILAATLWICVALALNTGGAEGATAMVANTTDIALAYFFGRIVFQSPRDFRVFLMLVLPGLLVIAAIMMVESITHRQLVHETMNSLIGGGGQRRVEIRMGLMRAFAGLPHPILAGLFLVSFMPLILIGGLRGWPRAAGLFVGLCAFFTLSSAVFLSLVATFALLGYNWLQARITNVGWKMALIAAGIAGFALEFLTQNGAMAVLTRYAALNSGSAGNRIHIWNWGTYNVQKNPWFGIGYADWERPSWMVASLDHYWLLLAVQFGVIVPFLIGLAVIVAVTSASRASAVLVAHDKQLLRALAISLSLFALGLLSVAVWKGPQIWFYMLIGGTVTLSSTALRMNERAHIPRASRVFSPADGITP